MFPSSLTHFTQVDLYFLYFIKTSGLYKNTTSEIPLNLTSHLINTVNVTVSQGKSQYDLLSRSEKAEENLSYQW